MWRVTRRADDAMRRAESLWLLDGVSRCGLLPRDVVGWWAGTVRFSLMRDLIELHSFSPWIATHHLMNENAE